MINDLYKLSRTLETANISIENWHPDYKELPSGDCYRIWLDDSGNVSGIDLLNRDMINGCRKYGNNQQTYPAFNIAALFRVTDEISLSESLQEKCTVNNWNEKLRKKLARCLSFTIPGVPEDSHVAKLMSITSGLSVDSFRSSIESFFWHELKLSNDIKDILPLLVYKGKPNKTPEEDYGSVSVILDLDNWKQYDYPITNKKTTVQINNWLMVFNDEKLEPEGNEFDAFGAEFKNSTKPTPLPSVRLMSGFEVTLRSMFREQICQFRYKKADDLSYPISGVSRNEIKKALEWICKEENEYITWRKVSANTILIVYPDKLPKISLKLAALLAGGNIDEETRFEIVSQQFIKTLDGTPSEQKPENIQVFALQQIPPALSKRAKVVYTNNFTASKLANSACEWQAGCENIPTLDKVEKIIPFPLQVASFVNNIWKQNGDLANTDKAKVKLMSNHDGIKLLIDDLSKNTVLYFVQGIVTNIIGLVKFIGNVLLSRQYEKKHTDAIGTLMPILGLLLYKNGFRKEMYMEDIAFLIGKILKISDGLHELYCEIKREGQIPPQLAGNAFFISAVETPNKALAQLGIRMSPYISWAKQYRAQGESKSGLAVWYLKMYEESMTALYTKLNENVQFNDYEKAKLFIGYLAELSKKNTDQNVISHMEDEQ